MLEILRTCPFFAGISDEQLESLRTCLSAKKRKYRRDEFICLAEERAVFVGVVLSGGANIISDDFWGNRTIITNVEPGELFGEAFSCAGVERLPVSVVATQPTEILLIDYKRIITTCSSTCVFHAQLISNMLQILAGKNIMLVNKMEYLSKRTTREKLLAFLSSIATQSKSGEIVIPFSRQELADFLCVERSALSRELGFMKRDGLIDFERNRFWLK